MGNWFGWGCPPPEEDRDAQQPMLSHANVSRIHLFRVGSLRKALSSHDQAVLELKVQRDRMIEYQKKLSYVIERENELARQKIREGKKKQALLALKKRKYQENLLAKTQTQLDNLREMVDSIEFARLEASVFEGLRLGTRVLNEIHSEMSIEAVEELMADTRAALQHQEEVDAKLSEALSSAAQLEVEEELRQLQAEEAAISAGAAPQKLPSAGTHEPAIAESTPVATASATANRVRLPA